MARALRRSHERDVIELLELLEDEGLVSPTLQRAVLAHIWSRGGGGSSGASLASASLSPAAALRGRGAPSLTESQRCAPRPLRFGGFGG